MAPSVTAQGIRLLSQLGNTLLLPEQAGLISLNATCNLNANSVYSNFKKGNQGANYQVPAGKKFRALLWQLSTDSSGNSATFGGATAAAIAESTITAPTGLIIQKKAVSFSGAALPTNYDILDDFVAATFLIALGTQATGTGIIYHTLIGIELAA